MPRESVERLDSAAAHAVLFSLRQLGGPAAMDGFLKAYIQQFASKSITTTDFLDFVHSYFDEAQVGSGRKLGERRAVKTHILNTPRQQARLSVIDWNAWLYTPGKLPVEHK